MIHVSGLAAVGHAYARVRREAGLPPYKGAVELRLSEAGPVLVEFNGAIYTLFIGGVPATC